MPLRRFTPAEMVLTQRLHLERPLLALVLLGAATFALAEGRAFLLLLTAAGVGVNALALHRRSEFYVPRWLVNLAVLGATGIFVLEFADFRSNRDVLAVLGRYLVLIQLCKLFEQKRNRDYVQLIALSLVLVVTGAMLTTSLWFALMLLAYVPVACYVGMVLTLKVALDRQAAACLPPEARPADPHKLAWQVSARLPRRHLAQLAAWSGAACVACAVFVFLLMPREQPGLLLPIDVPGGMGMSGFSPTVRLGAVNRIRLDDRVVMRVEVESKSGRGPRPRHNAVGDPVPADLYLRGRTLDTYIRGEWTRPGGSLGWWAGRPQSPVTAPAGDNVLVQKVVMDGSLAPFLFAVAPCVRADGVFITGNYPDLTADAHKLQGSIRYTAWSYDAPLTSEQLEFFRRLRGHAPTARPDSKIPNAVAELATEWCRDLLARRNVLPPDDADARGRLDREIAQRISLRLRTDYQYTLQPPPAPIGRDPVVEFLFRSRRGHCEYFASAMTLMCQSLGLHARLCAGFMSGDHGPDGFLVRNRDAHAWVEVFTPAQDWERFDPTPPAGPQHGAQGPLRRLWDSVAFRWRTSVIGYGESDRQSLFGQLLDAFERGWRGAMGRVKKTIASLWALITRGRFDPELLAGLAVLAATAGGASILVLGVRLWRRRARGGGRRLRAQLRRAPRFYRELVGLLRRAGAQPDPALTAREYLAAAAGQLRLGPPGQAVLAELGELHYRVRWGGEPAAAGSDRAGQLLAELRRHIAGRP